ncbi:MAG: response regulator [Spirochaetales bacterium]|nr:response regulator [Spirochaetales bacterium]
MKILVVDDSRIMRNIIKNTLQYLHQPDDEYVDAADGVEALEILMHNHIDLLLLDWNMPRLNGLELVKKLRSMEQFVHLPIIMITSEAAKYNVIEAIKEGVNDYLVKPVTERGLLSKIKRIFPHL